eukprot:3866586-Pleurochrysis_carterae.AAC.1
MSNGQWRRVTSSAEACDERSGCIGNAGGIRVVRRWMLGGGGCGGVRARRWYVRCGWRAMRNAWKRSLESMCRFLGGRIQGV